MTRQIITAVIVAGLLRTASTSQAEEPESAKMLGHIVGSWLNEVTDKPAKWLPNGAKHTDSEYTSWVLKDRFTLSRQMSQPNGAKSLWLTTYDPNSQNYQTWFFNSQGVLGGEWSGTWDEASKTMTSQAMDTPTGWTSRGTSVFSDNNTNHVAFWMRDQDGTLLFDTEAKKSRQPDETGKKTLTAWSKTEKSDTPLSPEMKVLKRLIGTWDVTGVSKPAEWTPEEVRTTSKVTRTWVLNESFVLDSSKKSDGRESLALLTYDPQQKAYRSWWFSSEGHTSKSTGAWDSVSETISFRSEFGNGLTSRSAVRFIDDDHHDWRVVVTDGNGKLYFDTKWTLSRSK